MCDEPLFGWAVSEVVEDLLCEAGTEMLEAVEGLPEESETDEGENEGDDGFDPAVHENASKDETLKKMWKWPAAIREAFSELSVKASLIKWGKRM